MKKSFIFGITMVLTLLLVFAGCGQSTSSSDDTDTTPGVPDGPQVSVQNGLAVIAAAFSDGRASTVTVTSPLYLYDGELVIPYDKTLVLDGVEITGLSDNSKLIGAGILRYPSGKTVDWRTRPGAKLIVTEAFKNSYIRLDGEVEDVRPFVAYENQIVYIQTFDDLLAYAASHESVPGFYSYGGILALKTPGTITEAHAKALAENTRGLKVYIVGNVSFSSDITLPNTGATVPPYETTTASRGILANYQPELDGTGKHTLVIAGDVSVNGRSVKADGFSVWGTLRDTTDGLAKEVTKDGTPLVAYTVDLYGPIFEDTVHLFGPTVNAFGPTATFGKAVTIEGPVVFREAKFNGAAVFNGHVTILKQGAKGVVFNDTVAFNGGGAIDSKFDVANGSLSVAKDSRVKFGFDLDEEFFSIVVGGIKDAASVELSVAPDKELKYTDYKNTIIITGNANVGTVATINGNVTFNDDVTFGTQVTIGGTATLTVNGTAEFKKNADLGGTDSTGSSATVYIKNPIFNGSAGSNYTYTNINNLMIGGSGPDKPAFIINGDDSTYGGGTATLVLDGGAQLTVSDGKLKLTGVGTISGAAITLNDGSGLALGSAATLNFGLPDDSGVPYGTPTVTFTSNNKNGGGFAVKGEVEMSEGLKGKGESPAIVTVNGDLFMELKLGLLPIDNATLDISKSGDHKIIFAGTISPTIQGSAAITLTNTGTLITSKGKATNGMIIGTQGASAGTVSLITGSTSTSGWGTLSGTNYPGDASGSISNAITRETSFTKEGTIATVDKVTTYTTLPGNLIEVFKNN
jgi:hypothetical protein